MGARSRWAGGSGEAACKDYAWRAPQSLPQVVTIDGDVDTLGQATP